MRLLLGILLGMLLELLERPSPTFFEDNSILPLPERLEASGVESVWGEVSQESPKNRGRSGKIGL